MKQLNTQRITNLKLEQVLFCSKSMHFLEVKSFIERTLLDNCSEYVILGYQHLSAECQQYIIDAVNQHRREKDKEDRVKLKLCLVGNSTIESIFKFFRHLPDIEFR